MQNSSKDSAGHGFFNMEDYLLTNGRVIWLMEVIFVVLVMALSYFVFVDQPEFVMSLPKHFAMPIFLFSLLLSAMMGVVGIVFLTQCRIVDGAIFLAGFALNLQVTFMT